MNGDVAVQEVTTNRAATRLLPTSQMERHLPILGKAQGHLLMFEARYHTGHAHTAGSIHNTSCRTTNARRPQRTLQNVVEVGCWIAMIHAVALGNIQHLAQAIGTTGSTMIEVGQFVVASNRPTASAARQPRPGATPCVIS